VGTITPANVAASKSPDLRYREAIDQFRAESRFGSHPVMTTAKLYVSTQADSWSRSDTETGREIGKQPAGVARPQLSDFANRGVHRGGDTIFVGTADARLIASIAPLVSSAGFGKEGTVELPKPRHRPRYDGEYGVSSPPAYYHALRPRLIIVGSFIADNSRAQMHPEVRAFDAKTGSLVWTFHPLPENSPAGRLIHGRDCCDHERLVSCYAARAPTTLAASSWRQRDPTRSLF